MTYQKGSIVITDGSDIPLLREVRNSRFVTRIQLFELLNHEGQLDQRADHRRVERLLKGGYLRTFSGLFWRGSAVYSIARKGLLELEGRGEANLVLHSGAPDRSNVMRAYHCLELNEIRLALAHSSLLADWKSGLEIASGNMVSASFQHDYDAVVSMWAGDRIFKFALEYERSLGSARKYKEIREAIAAERSVAGILYLTVNADLIYALICHLVPNVAPLAFATAGQFCRQLLETPVLTDLETSAILFDDFVTAASAHSSAAGRRL